MSNINGLRGLVCALLLSAGAAFHSPAAYAQAPHWTPPAPLNSYATEDSGTDETDPHIATDGAGNWVTVWQNAYGVYASHSADMGNSWSNPVTLELSNYMESRGAKVGYAGGGTWVALWTSYETDGQNNTTTATLMSSRSTDGLQWSAALPVAPPGITPVFSQLLDVDFDGDGTIIVTDGPQIIRSADHGLTWSADATLDVPVYYIIRSGQVSHAGGSDWIHAVCYVNSYMSPQLSLYVATSSDKGVTWSDYHLVSESVVMRDMAAKGNTVVIAGSTNHHLPNLSMITSADGGDTWSGPVQGEPIGGLTGSAFSLQVNDANQWLLVIDRMSVFQPIQNHDLIAMRSTNPATSWTAFETIVREERMHEIRPTLATDAAGNMVIVYQARAFYNNGDQMPVPPDYDIKAVSSKDSGTTWTEPQLVNAGGLTDLPFMDDQNVDMASGDNGVVVAIWQVNTSFQIMFARSDDYGQTWSNTAPVSLQPPFAVNPQIHYRGNGSWFAWWHSNGTNLHSYVMSHDNGFTWTNPDTFYGYAAADSDSANGTMVKAHHAGHDPLRYGLARLNKGAQYWDEPTIIPHRPVHIAHSGGSNWFSLTYFYGSPTDVPTGVYWSNDDGRTWTHTASTNQAPSHSTLASNHNGVTIAAWTDASHTGGSAPVYISRTSDNGITWSAPVAVGASAAGYTSAQVASAGDNDWVVVWGTSEAGQPANMARLYATASRDNGITWSAPAPVVGSSYIPADTGQQNHGLTGSDGKLVIAWEMSKPYDFNTIYGYDTDLFYSYGLIDPPPTAAQDWQLFE